MNAHDANVSTASITDDAAAFPPLIVPADTPAYARQVLANLDRVIAREALTLGNVPFPSALHPGRCGTAAAGEAGVRRAHIRDKRLIVAGRMHARAGGATAFFLFHYLRLLAEQCEAGAAGRAAPIQAWTMPDWSPAAPASQVPFAADHEV